MPGLLLLAAVMGSLLLGFLRLNRRLPRGSLDRDLGLCCEAGFLSLIASCAVIHVQEAPMAWQWLGLACAWIGLPRSLPAEP